MKKPLTLANTLNIAVWLALAAAGVLAGYAFSKGPAQPVAQVLHDLPPTIESSNPVPEVRSWSEGGRKYYYFNWGLKPNSGYRLEFAGLKGNRITIRAVAPGPGEMAAQVLSYPYLLIALPDGNYRYEVTDAAGKALPDAFKPEHPPLRLNLFLPGPGGTFERTVLRDPFLNTAGKSRPKIILDALFSQTELLEYAENDIWVQGVSFAPGEQTWLVDLGPGWNQLSAGDQGLLTQVIAKTLAANGSRQWAKVRISGSGGTAPANPQ